MLLSRKSAMDSASRQGAGPQTTASLGGVRGSEPNYCSRAEILDYEREPRLPHRAIGLGDLGMPQHKQEHKWKGIFRLARSYADPQIVRAKVAGTIGSTWSAVSPRSSLL